MTDLRCELKQVWETLLQETTSDSDNGFRKIRLQTPLKCDFFAAVDASDSRLMLMIEIPSAQIRHSHKYPDIAGLEIRPKFEKNFTRIFLKVIDSKYNELFENLCLDLVGEASNAKESQQCIDRFFYKLNIWKDFFKSLSHKTLDRNSAQGLLGELYFIADIGSRFIPPRQMIQYWEGPSGSEYDFRFQEGNVEIKTLKSTSDTMSVSNLNQLDDQKCGNLFVAHIAVETLPENSSRGYNLPELVDKVRKLLKDTPEALIFDQKLLAAGYTENTFEDLRMETVKHSFYHIRDDFPRLIPSNVPVGIKAAKYAVDLAVCKNFEVTGNTVFSAVKGA